MSSVSDRGEAAIANWRDGVFLSRMHYCIGVLSTNVQSITTSTPISPISLHCFKDLITSIPSR